MGANTIEITDANFEEEVISSDKPVLIDFWAEWCGPCKMLAPVVEELASERDDIKVGKMNIDENQQVPATYGVMSIPTLLIFKSGEVSERIVGTESKQAITEKINAVLAG